LKVRTRPPSFQPVHKIVVSYDNSVRLNWHSVKFVDCRHGKSRLALLDTMRLKHSERSTWGQFPTMEFAIVAILVLGLLGGLFHHHESASDSAACSYCHAGVQTPEIDLAAALVAASFAVVGFVTLSQPSCLPRSVRFSTLIPRAPPSQLIPSFFGRVVWD
jgi:hypothetical protein